MHFADVFQDRSVHIRPRHAEDVKQDRPVGGSEDVRVVQVTPTRQGVEFRYSASIRCAARRTCPNAGSLSLACHCSAKSLATG